ncbi:MAG TPA: zinc metallopeptidase [Candidatus Fimimorpha faecalis]|uniref:Zinc metallopeptidase n=1 Tax=Candidatus Fimimorpha faecalis TaxID=2840824 RepID=A0A9D1JEH3_9FIRM|nr:zinc metallopeptidase [Candidatus Fimimorpha faecalis]
MYSPFMMYWDWTYIFVIIAAVISAVASMKVNTTFSRYSGVRAISGMTGAEAAQRILRSQGIMDVQVRHVSGNLTDHYDPRSKILNLSDSVYGSTSVAAIGVAAHECGHAVQHQVGYAPLNIRSTLVPIANFGQTISWPLILIGFLLNGSVSQMFLYAGVILFSAAVLFQLVTLPVEFNASSRALRLLQDNGILASDEIGKTRKVLSAAALTYVAGAIGAILQLLRLLILIGGRRRDD